MNFLIIRNNLKMEDIFVIVVMFKLNVVNYNYITN